MHEAIDAAYDEYAPYAAAARQGAPDHCAGPQEAAASLCWRAAYVDPEVNHGIDQLIIRRGAAVSEDSVSWHEQKFQTAVLNQWTYHSRLYAAAKYCTENPRHGPCAARLLRLRH